MRFSSDDFKLLYAEMPDDELRSLVREELSEVARPCYDEELTRRGLVAAVRRSSIQDAVRRFGGEREIADREEPLDEALAEQVMMEQADEDLAPAAVFGSREEAKTARGHLQSSAIPAFLEDDTAAGGGFRLLVAASYVEQAQEILKTPPEADEEV